MFDQNHSLALHAVEIFFNLILGNHWALTWEISDYLTGLLSNLWYTFIFYKQLGSDLNPQSRLNFQVFRGSKLLNGCLVFWQVTYVCEEYNHFQDSKSIFMIGDFNIFPIMLLRQLNFGVLSVYLRLLATKEKHNFFNLQFLLLLSESWLNPESCLAICYPRASCL